MIKLSLFPDAGYVGMECPTTLTNTSQLRSHFIHYHPLSMRNVQRLLITGFIGIFIGLIVSQYLKPSLSYREISKMSGLKAGDKFPEGVEFSYDHSPLLAVVKH